MGRRKKYAYKPFPSPRSTEAKQAVCILEIQVIWTEQKSNVW